MTVVLNQIAFPPLLRLRLVFEAQHLIAPPRAIGAMWRGVLGAALHDDSPGAYQRLFHPVPPDHAAISHASMPSPFVIDADPPAGLVAAPGETLMLDITLIGDAAAEAQAVIGAFARAGETGLGKTRGWAALTHVGQVWTETEDPGPETPPVPPRPPQAMIVLRTPWRTGAKGPTGTEDFRMEGWLRALQRRIDALARIHSAAPARGAPLPKVRIHDVQLWSHNMTRWSANLTDEDDMTGLMGAFRATLPADDALWRALWWSQWVHVGRKTSFGLGSVRVHPIYD